MQEEPQEEPQEEQPIPEQFAKSEKKTGVQPKGGAMRIRGINCILSVVLCLAMAGTPVLADTQNKTEIDIDTNGSATLISGDMTGNSDIQTYVDQEENEDPSNGSSASHKNTHSGGKSHVTIPQYIIDARTARNNLVNILKQVMTKVDNPSSNVRIGTKNDTDLVISSMWGSMQEPELFNTLCDYYEALGSDYLTRNGLMDPYQNLLVITGRQSNLNPDSEYSGASMVDHQSSAKLPASDAPETEYEGFSDGEKPTEEDMQEAWDQIVAPSSYYEDATGSSSTGGSVVSMHPFIDSSMDPSTYAEWSSIAPISFTHLSDYVDSGDNVWTIRPDLVNGGMLDNTSYASRYSGLIRQLAASGKTNAALSDDLKLTYILDYHLTKVERTDYEIIDYDPATRIWGVYNKDTGELIEEKQTDNPEHAFTFEGYPKGSYTVKCSAIGHYKMQEVASYDKYQYLVDSGSKMILYYNRTTGTPCTIETGVKEGKVFTGEEWNINVTDSGIEKGNGSSMIQRVK